MNKIRVGRKPMAEINVVPYIDVMLVLLIVFMVTAPLLTQGIKVNLPDSNNAGVLKEQQDPVIVSLSEQGEYFLNVGEQSDAPLDLEALQQALFKIRQAQPNVPIFLEGDEAVFYGQVVFLLAALQEAGIARVSLVTEPTGSNVGR